MSSVVVRYIPPRILLKQSCEAELLLSYTLFQGKLSVWFSTDIMAIPHVFNPSRVNFFGNLWPIVASDQNDL